MNDFEKHLQDKINQLPKCVEPEKELWTGIEIALNSSVVDDKGTPSKKVFDSGSWNKPWVLAASFAFIAVLSWFGLQSNNGTVTASPEQLVALLAQQHQEQKEALLVSYKESVPLTQNWQAQLSELDDAAEAIKVALKEDPNNKALLKMLQQVYQQQISLIENVHSPKWQKI